MKLPCTMVITIGRQIGSGGTELGRRLADRLGYAYIDHEIVERAAEELGIDKDDLKLREERVTNFWERVARVLFAGSPDAVYSDVRHVPEVPDELLFRTQSRVIHELVAARDSVLIGHAGFHALRTWPGLVSVFTHACRSARIERLASAYGVTDPEEAKAVIERTDRQRQRFIADMTGNDWTNARNYDLCIDTSRIPMERAEEMVAALVEQKRALLQSEAK